MPYITKYYKFSDYRPPLDLGFKVALSVSELTVELALGLLVSKLTIELLVYELTERLAALLLISALMRLAKGSSFSLTLAKSGTSNATIWQFVLRPTCYRRHPTDSHS